MAYFLYPDVPGDSASYSMEWIDGDYSKVSLIDVTPDGGTAIHPRITFHFLAGRPVQDEFLPTKMKSDFSGKRFPDYCAAASGALAVSDKFKNIVETYEPSIHQFFPFDIISKKGELRETMYIMIICNRLDTVNIDKTNRIFFKERRWKKREDDRTDPDRAQWKGKDRLVLDTKKIGNAHLWIDKHLDPQESRMMSNQLATALREAELSHVGLREVEEG